MRTDAIPLEEERLSGIQKLDEYPAFHERHRIFPQCFENRGHRRVLDIASGVGVVGRNIRDGYPAELLCNDISETCLQIMKDTGLQTVSFDIDDPENPFPFPEGSFDAVIALAVIEHTINTEYFIREIGRILQPGGYLYISAPNYSGLTYLLPFLLSGKTFHDPLSERDRYEFYAHVRYFTYRTLLEYVSSFQFAPEAVYLPIPHASSRYAALKSRSPLKALAFRRGMQFIYKYFSPRWASEPVICFRKGAGSLRGKPRKAIL
ncbi:MAG TPA: class I SAM-dependent methyltransferase [Syntrophobacter fumaroxidans]|nr:class I SAM-dependent methyltransferase [Syntrophobacter fumaroxidans]